MIGLATMLYKPLYYGNQGWGGGTFPKDLYKYYPVSGVAFDLSKKIEGDSACRVYDFNVPRNGINVLILELLICNGVYKLKVLPEMGYNIYKIMHNTEVIPETVMG